MTDLAHHSMPDAERERPFAAGGAPLLTADEMREWDRQAIQERGIPERVLMEAAGRAAAEVVHSLYSEGRVVAAVGGGNNGGDALVLLRTLAARGRRVAAVQAGGALPDRALLHDWELEVLPATEAEAAFRGAGVVVDGILGTGAKGAPRDPAAGVIGAMNASGRPVVALDGPSGVDMTTGRAEGAAVRAALTITSARPSAGCCSFRGGNWRGASWRWRSAFRRSRRGRRAPAWSRPRGCGRACRASPPTRTRECWGRCASLRGAAA